MGFAFLPGACFVESPTFQLANITLNYMLVRK